MTKLFIALQYVLPQHLLSRLVGFLARTEWSILKNFLIEQFIRSFKVNMTECDRTEPAEFQHFNDFFTRSLKDGARVIPEDATVCFSPVDGAISQIGTTENGRVVQAKGQDYALADLLADDELAARLQGGAFTTLYLSPKDYHRIHMPFDGTLTKMIHVPGALFSVNTATADAVPGLFARNERVVCVFDTEHGEVAMVLVGAMIVASISTAWHGEVTPVRGIQRWDYKDPTPVRLKRGDELGRFALGSTVVMCTEPGKLEWDDELDSGDDVRLGMPLGRWS
ncbi:MAG: archaetidylserine decarboxylase [Litorivicinus sp.]